MAETGIIVIHGKEYHTVAKRVQDFRADHPDYAITTDVMDTGQLVRVRATIWDNQSRKLSTGHAEENREIGINRSSAIENAETSACGRALALLGYGGTDIASADEMQLAEDTQRELAASRILLDHNEALRAHLSSIVYMKDALANGDFGIAKEAWQEIPEADQRSLWVAPTKGGIFTTEERNQMKSSEWSQANG